MLEKEYSGEMPQKDKQDKNLSLRLFCVYKALQLHLWQYRQYSRQKNWINDEGLWLWLSLHLDTILLENIDAPHVEQLVKVSMYVDTFN